MATARGAGRYPVEGSAAAKTRKPAPVARCARNWAVRLNYMVGAFLAGAVIDSGWFALDSLPPGIVSFAAYRLKRVFAER